MSSEIDVTKTLHSFRSNTVFSKKVQNGGLRPSLVVSPEQCEHYNIGQQVVPTCAALQFLKISHFFYTSKNKNYFRLQSLWLKPESHRSGYFSFQILQIFARHWIVQVYIIYHKRLFYICCMSCMKVVIKMTYLEILSR